MAKEISVVILDDETNILKALKRLFRDEAFGVYVTTSYAEALEAMEKNKVKVVITDQKMPLISGIEFLKKVNEKYPGTLRVLFTGYADIKVAEDAINLGEVYRFIEKPWDDSELKNCVREAINRFDLSEENKRLNESVKKQNEELAKLNEKLQGLYVLQREFSSKVSHELGTPLASIKLMLDVVMSNTAGELTDKQRNFLKKAEDNVDRLARLIADLLSLAKYEVRKTELDMKKGDINKVITDVAEMQKPVAEKQNLYLKMELAKDMPNVVYDSDKIIQVLNNLINNAIKFTTTGGITVSSSVNPDANNVEVRVEDTGVGIREADKVKLFSKFQQIGSQNAKRSKGTGLGLAICKEILEQHGGRIWVESRPDGLGSSFCFLLPLNEPRATSDE
ncbi:MAG: hybrid sensor histidine kinase/response regulator [Candidatus Omnitrophota bacterium]